MDLEKSTVKPYNAETSTLGRRNNLVDSLCWVGCVDMLLVGCGGVVTVGRWVGLIVGWVVGSVVGRVG